MKSPFPGMDPYLQQYWRDVHSRLIVYACDELKTGLPATLVARVNERVFVEIDGEPGRNFYPDVFVVERQKRKGSRLTSQGEVALAEPVIVRLPNEPVTETFIEILDAKSGKKVITTIEFISPTNKIPGTGLDLYRQKQLEAEQAGVSLVEIDLVLGGNRALSVPLSRIQFRYRTRYQAIIRRGWNWDEAAVYRMPLQERLPTIPVPLRQKDQEVPLNLQALVEKTYQNGSYDDLDYQEDADPPLEGHDAEWADALLRKAGKRK
jgi:hypothetical protein